MTRQTMNPALYGLLTAQRESAFRLMEGDVLLRQPYAFAFGDRVSIRNHRSRKHKATGTILFETYEMPGSPAFVLVLLDAAWAHIMYNRDDIWEYDEDDPESSFPLPLPYHMRYSPADNFFNGSAMVQPISCIPAGRRRVFKGYLIRQMRHRLPRPTLGDILIARQLFVRQRGWQGVPFVPASLSHSPRWAAAFRDPDTLRGEYFR